MNDQIGDGGNEGHKGDEHRTANMGESGQTVADNDDNIVASSLESEINTRDNIKNDIASSSNSDNIPLAGCESPDDLAANLANLDENRIVKHIMVIGFHHKHGYQVDYCYPPLEPNGPVFSTPVKPISLPSCWKTLPLLCLPDGSHNYDSDTIYFTMPDHLQQRQTRVNDNNDDDVIKNELLLKQEKGEKRELTEAECIEASKPSKPTSNRIATKSNGEGIKTIYGTACYRQIQADKLRNRTDDMTRVAVQKSVCVLSTKPLFGLIRSKLEMITHAYFEELDFSKVKILKLTYDNLNSLLSRDSVKENATFLGLSARNLVSQFHCNMLVLFKAMLLEKKILFYKSPVRDLCSTIMSMCSLFTGLLECSGLDHSTCDLQLSPTLLEALRLSTPYSKPTMAESNCDEETNEASKEDKVFFSPSKGEVVIISNAAVDLTGSSGNNAEQPKLELAKEAIELYADSFVSIPGSQDEESQRKNSVISNKQEEAQREMEQTGEYEVINEDSIEVQDDETLSDGTIVDDPYALKLCRLKPEDCGLPLQIFTRGSFCLPYLSISYLDLLSDTRVKSFVIGATNFLFKQRKEMYDVIVDMEENSIIINDPNLKKCLSLTTEDLRFMDHLSRHVKLDNSQPKDEFDLINNDITKWVGGDEWIRYHFRLYTIYLLKASKNPTSYDFFNSQFVQTWKQTTNNYKIWGSTGKASILDGLQLKHPFSSRTKGLNFSDMRLKLSYAVNSSEKGRIINQTLSGIGKWSIWNNIASAAQAATTASVLIASATSTSAAAAASALSSHHQADSKQAATAATISKVQQDVCSDITGDGTSTSTRNERS